MVCEGVCMGAYVRVYVHMWLLAKHCMHWCHFTIIWLHVMFANWHNSTDVHAGTGGGPVHM